MCPQLKKFFLTGLLLGLLPAAPALGQGDTMVRPGSGGGGSAGRATHSVLRAEAPVRIDGVLDDAIWARADAVTLPWEVDPGNNTPAPVATRCWTAFDESNLYFACDAEDPDPSGIRAYVTDRDRIGGHDRIILAIDPFNDSRRAFLFVVSPLGVQLDATWQQGDADVSWDAIWNSAGRITETGYVVEAAIPFKSLRFPAGGETQTWGAWFERRRPRTTDARYMSMAWDRNNSCLLCQGALLTGFEGISPGRNLELTPTFTSSRSDFRSGGPGTGLERGDVEASPGLDARIGLTPAVTLNATVNPDFSQVEADVAQLNVNERFALFFPERRPFFLEGADLFDTPLRVVFTRTIADPVFGTKVSGKQGSAAFGALVARDRVTNLLFPGAQGSSATTLDAGVTTVIGRFRQDIGRSSTLGVLYTGREGSDGYYNRVGGVDAFWQPFGPVTVRVQAVHSETAYPEATAQAEGQPTEGFGGNAADLQLRYSTRTWSGGSNLRVRSTDFRADAGFVPQVGTRGASAWGGRTFWAPANSWYTSLRVNGGAWHESTTGGNLIVEGVWGGLNYSGPKQSFLYVNPNVWREEFAGQRFNIVRTWFGGSIQPTGSLGFSLDANAGDAVDFANAKAAHVFTVEPGVNLLVGRHLDFNVSHRLQRFTRDGEEVFKANLSQLRTVYSHDARTFLRLILQYRQVDRNPAQFEDAVNRSTKGLFTSLLFSYKVNPLTVLFLGYSDSRDGRTEFDRTDVPFETTARSLFLKVGYAWRP